MKAREEEGEGEKGRSPERGRVCTLLYIYMAQMVKNLPAMQET